MKQTILLAGPEKERLIPLGTIAQKLGYSSLIETDKDKIAEILIHVEIDLLILDIRLDGLFEMCRALRQNPFYLTLPVVLLVDDPVEDPEVWQAGINDRLLFPGTNREVFSLLKKYL